MSSEIYFPEYTLALRRDFVYWILLKLDIIKFFLQNHDIGKEYNALSMNMPTEYARDILSLSSDSLHIFSDCHSAMLVIMPQNRSNYHNSTVRAIWENLMHGHQSKSPKHQNSILPSPSRYSFVANWGGGGGGRGELNLQIFRKKALAKKHQTK